MRILPGLLYRDDCLGVAPASKAGRHGSTPCVPAVLMEVAMIRCPECESESVTWDPNGAECFSCGWHGWGYDLWDDGIDDDDSED